jgi:hypothetical protein
MSLKQNCTEKKPFDEVAQRLKGEMNISKTKLA